MRLTCSRCGAEYEIDDALIPESGREVECSSCDHVWFQTRADTAPATPPPPSRQLPENVMAVLRDEAAQFRALHPHIEAESAPAPPSGADMRPAPKAATEKSDTIAPVQPVDKTIIAPDTPLPPSTGPATASAASVEAPIPPIAEDNSGARAHSGPHPLHADQAAANASAIIAAAANAAGELPRTTPAAPEPAPAQPRRGGFRRGFLIGLLIAALFFGAYMAAPHMGEGPVGDILRQIHDYGNEAHRWLHEKTALVQAAIRDQLAGLR